MRKTVFEKKVAKFERKSDRAFNYIKRTNFCLTDGFWNNVGSDMDDMLEDLKTNHKEEWKEYQESRGYCWDISVSDCLC